MKNNNGNTSIARELIKKMEQILLQKNITKIDLFVSNTNTKAINLYTKLGFIETRKLMLKDIQ